MTAAQLADALGVSVETVSRMENDKRRISGDELEVIASVTGVPASFLREGFEPNETDARERLEALEAQQAEDSARLAQLEEVVRALAARDRPAATAEARRR